MSYLPSPRGGDRRRTAGSHRASPAIVEADVALEAPPDAATAVIGAGRRTLAPFGRRLARVTANDGYGAYRLITLRDAAGPPDPRPGQFYMLATASGWGAEGGGRPYLPRAFSFCRVRSGGEPGQVTGTKPGETALDFLLEAIGPGTGRLARVAPDEEMWLTGPLGLGFSPPREGTRPVLVGGGIGVAPIVCLHDELAPSARVLLGFRSSAHADAVGLFGAGSLEPPRVATDDGSVGRHALVTELLREELDADPAATVYACGPPAMLEGVRAICAEREVSAELALEAGMACGFGACYGCVVPTRGGYVRLCVDGPVLAAAALETAAGPGAGH